MVWFVGTCRKCAQEAIGVRRVRVAAQTFTATCDDLCDDHGSVDRGIARHLAERGPVTGAGFRRMREITGFQAKRWAELLGTRPATISQWENDAVRVDLWAWTVLAAVVLEQLGGGGPSTLDRLKAVRSTHTKSVSFSVPECIGLPRVCDDAKRLALVSIVTAFVRARHEARKKTEKARWHERKRLVQNPLPEWRWDDDEVQLAKFKAALLEVDERVGKVWTRVERTLYGVFVTFNANSPGMTGYERTHAPRTASLAGDVNAVAQRGTGPIAAAAEIAWRAGIEPCAAVTWDEARAEITCRFYNATRRSKR